MEIVKISGKQIDWTGAIQYVRTQDVEVIRNCYSIMITNLGDTIVQINEITLFPSATPATDAGDSITITGNEGDLLTMPKLRVRFASPAGILPLVEIVQLYYKDI